MSEVKRYNPHNRPQLADNMDESDSGRWVKASDYDQLQAENELLVAKNGAFAGANESLKNTIDAIVAENDQLREGMRGDYDLDSWLDWCKERDTLRKQLDESDTALGAKNARIAEYAERHLKDSELLDEARELLTGWRAVGRSDGVDAYNWEYKVDAWLKKNPA